MENKNKKNEIILCKTCSHELMYSDFSINMKENEDFEIFKKIDYNTRNLIITTNFKENVEKKPSFLLNWYIKIKKFRKKLSLSSINLIECIVCFDELGFVLYSVPKGYEAYRGYIFLYLKKIVKKKIKNEKAFKLKVKFLETIKFMDEFEEIEKRMRKYQKQLETLFERIQKLEVFLSFAFKSLKKLSSFIKVKENNLNIPNYLLN